MNNSKKNNYKTKNKTKIKKYLAETYKSRISRDIFVYTKTGDDYEFLVKPWSNPQHRAKGFYGNAFGTFLCRPPKDKEDLERQINPPVNAKSMLDPQRKKYVLIYNLKKEIIGFKTGQLKTVLRDNFSNLNKSYVECYKIPSSKDTKYSLLSKGMTILATFIEIKKENFDNFIWINSETACNSKINIHGGIISHFMNDKKERTNKKILKYFPKMKHINNQKILKGNNIKKIYNLVNNY